MEIREKIEQIIKAKGLNQKTFAQFIGLNHISFNRNINNNNITGEMIKAFVEHLKDIDLNWLLRDELGENGGILSEPGIQYYSNGPVKKLEKAMKLLEELKRDLSQ